MDSTCGELRQPFMVVEPNHADPDRGHVYRRYKL
jgi:hypothetical protein